MGGMLFNPEILVDSLSETAGYKAGLALSLDAMCDHLADTGYADLLRESELQMVRIRSEEYEELFYKLLHRIGYTDEEYDGDHIGVRLFHKYRGTENEQVHERVLELFIEHWPKLMEETKASGGKSIDPTPFIKACAKEFGRIGVEMAIEKIEVINKGLNLNPHSGLRYTEWGNVEQLDTLFSGGGNKPEHGRFIDQRFINYLNANPEKLEDMHWRKFEELTAEYFNRDGYKVELGPGRNDDGVDVRIWKDWKNQDNESPHCIIQCKRQKKKIEKVIIKGLYADIQFEEAECGLLVTTSDLSPGARKTITVRGYPIDEVNNAQLRKWLTELHIPGTGVVRV